MRCLSAITLKSNLCLRLPLCWRVRTDVYRMNGTIGNVVFKSPVNQLLFFHGSQALKHGTNCRNIVVTSLSINMEFTFLQVAL